jgi:aldehyde dehydrogenase (NAD+)
LELGGKSPVLVFKSADIEEAAKWAATAIWFDSGQDCTAGSRVYVQEEVYDEFIGTLKRLAGEVAIGLVSCHFLRLRLELTCQPEDDKTSFGPLVRLASRQIHYRTDCQISKPQQEKVLNYIQIGKMEGAEVINGGTNWSKAPDGYYVMPTILGGSNSSMRVVQEEVNFSLMAVSSSIS